jgi:hypothetical protein
MAQTIVARTGTLSSIQWYEPTMHTLFTQSTGAAAKVILNQLACTFPTGSYPYYPRFSWWIGNSSMGYKHMIGYYAYQQMSKSVGIFPGTKTPQSNGQGSFIAANFVNQNASYTTLESVSNLLPNITINSGSLYFPDTFYMNNGDTLYIRGDSYDSNLGAYTTGSCYYNFTTIVES